MLGKAKSQNLCKQVLKRCDSNPAEVILIGKDNSLTRFANNTIHQNVAENNLTLIVRLFEGKKSGMATTNRLESVALDQLVSHARLNAQSSPENPDHPGLAEPTTIPEVEVYDLTTAEIPPEDRAYQVGIVCRLATEKGLNASGAFSTGVREITVANTEGVFAHHANTQADFQTVVMADNSSGWAQTSSWNVSDIPVESLGREAIQKAERGRDPRKIEAGEYPIVFDPYATQDMLSMLNLYGISALLVQEGRSWMNERLGEQVMSPNISIWDDGLDPQGGPLPFDFEGVPRQRVDIVKEGVVMCPVYDRKTAHKDRVNSTGHALPPNLPAYLLNIGPIAMNLFMAPGSSSLEEMIRSIKRGLYITRFWYTRLVHPRDCVITGMTRDGTFMIENGEISYPVKNLRFTQSYIHALANVEAIGSETRLLVSELGYLHTRVPGLKIGAFNFTGSTV